MVKVPSASFALALSLAFGTVLGTAGLLSGLSSPASAQSAPASARANQSFGGFFAPKGKAAPRNTEGGASRGRCIQDTSQGQQAVKLLTPKNNLGLTTSPRPVFMAYVDQSTAEQVFFSLKTDDESYFYEMTMKLPKQSAGIVQFQLPESAPPLEAGQQYLWSVALICGSKLGPDSPWASSWIERVAPSPEVAALASNAAPAALATSYGKQGLWYDTVAVLANWKTDQSDPGASAAWKKLLESQDLGQFATATISQ